MIERKERGLVSMSLIERLQREEGQKKGDLYERAFHSFYATVKACEQDEALNDKIDLATGFRRRLRKTRSEA